MSGTGKVVEVVGASVPATNASARLVTVERADGSWICFDIAIGCDPAVGATISWGPHHAWWDGHKVAKLSWERDPNAPLAPTGYRNPLTGAIG